MTAEIARIEACREEELARFKKERDELQTSQAALLSKVASLEADAATLNSNVDSLSAEVEELETAIWVAQNERNIRNTQLHVSQEAEKMLTLQMDELQADLAQMEGDFKELKREHNTSLGEFEETTTTAVSLLSTLQETSKNLKCQQDELRSEKRQSLHYFQQAADSVKQLEVKVGEYANLKESMDILTVSLREEYAVSADLREKHAEATDDLEKCMESLMVKTTEACKLKREIKVYQSKLDKETSAGASWQTKYTLCHSDCTEMDRNFAACRATWTAARTFECKIGKLTSSRTVLRRRFVAWKTNMCFARLQQKDNDMLPTFGFTLTFSNSADLENKPERKSLVVFGTYAKTKK